MKCIDRAALNWRASPLFSAVLDLELIQTLTQTAVISRVQLPERERKKREINEWVQNQTGNSTAVKIISVLQSCLWPLGYYKLS